MTLRSKAFASNNCMQRTALMLHVGRQEMPILDLRRQENGK